MAGNDESSLTDTEVQLLTAGPTGAAWLAGTAVALMLVGAKSVVMTDRIIGCPHEEGIDYEGPTCPDCPFWAGRDRWTGKRLQ